MINKIFYLPTYYWFNFNLKGLNNLFGYIFTLHLPIITLCLIFIDFSNYFLFLFLYLISFLIFITFYEFFYIQNDYLSTKEKEPTLRFNFDSIDIPWIKVFIIRLLYILFMYLILLFLKVDIINHLIVLLSIGIVFFIHNILKTEFRFLSFFLLYFLKVVIFFQFFSGFIPNSIYIYYTLLFCFFGTIPYFFKKNLKKKFPLDTINYYLFTFLLLGLYIFFIIDNLLIIIIILSLITIKYFKKLGN